MAEKFDLTPTTAEDFRSIGTDLSRWAKFYIDLAEEMQSSGIEALDLKGWSTLLQATGRIPGAVRSAETAMRKARLMRSARTLPGNKVATAAEMYDPKKAAADDADIELAKQESRKIAAKEKLKYPKSSTDKKKKSG
jgi:hypothetical protein